MTAVMEVDPYRIDSKSVRLGVTVTKLCSYSVLLVPFSADVTL